MTYEALCNHSKSKDRAALAKAARRRIAKRIAKRTALIVGAFAVIATLVLWGGA